MAIQNDIRATKRVTSHPGAILKHEYLEPLGMSAASLAAQIGVPANRLTEMIAGRRNMTADTALRLAERFGTSPEFWMNMQSLHDLSKAIVARRKHAAA